MRRYFAFSLHKAGSTLFYNLLSGCAARSQRTDCGKRMRYVSIPDQLFNAGTPESVLFDRDFVSPVSLDERDTIYGGFRFVPGFLDERHLAGAGVMILARDPRDMLTSLYFSIAKSHVMPPGEAGRQLRSQREQASAMTIDEFVLGQARHGDWVQRYRRIGALRDRARTWRYEDVIFDKARWLDEILAFLALDLPAAHRQALVQREDVMPASDRPDEHVRQVRPGDHRRKLRPETVEALDAIFAEALGTWNYSN